MKKVIFILMLAVAGMVYGQIDSLIKVYDSFPDDDSRKASMMAIAEHGRCTQITGFELNFVNGRIQDFISRYTYLSLYDEPQMNLIGDNKYLIEKYQQKMYGDPKKPIVLTVKYSLLIDKQDRLFIKNCKIFGRASTVIDFYVRYWPTTLNFNAAKENEIVINYLIQDRIALSWQPTKDYAEINITNTTYK